MAEKPDTFIREVDEEYRREQLRQLWDQYGLMIILGAVAVLAGVWGYTHWLESRANSAALHGAQMVAAMRLEQEGKADDAQKAFAELAKVSAPGYRGLSELRIAALHVKAGRKDEAVKVYDTMAVDTTIDSVVRDLAGLKAANLRLGVADLAEMERRLSTLMLDAAPWRAAAREIQGLAYYKAGKIDEARKVFEQLLVDRTASQGISERAQLMLSVLTESEAVAAPPAKAPKAAAPPEKTKDKSASPPPAEKK